MPAEETRYGLPYALLADAPDEEVATKALAEAIRNIEFGQRDALESGVLVNTDWSFTAAINAATGELSSAANTGGTAWISDPVLAGALMRTVTVPAKLNGLKPPSLPAAGKYMSVGFQLTPSKWGAAPTVSLTSGVEKASLAEAEAAPAVAVAGKLRIKDVVIKNAAGVYAIEKEFDRRPWARGINYSANIAGEELNATPSEKLMWTRRFETQAPVLIVNFACGYEIQRTAGTNWMIFEFKVDGTLRGSWAAQMESTKDVRQLSGQSIISGGAIPAGSHLCTLTMKNNSSALGGTTTRMISTSLTLSIRESFYELDEGRNGTA